MKKISLLGICFLTGLVASAQADRIKDAEHKLKGYNPDYSGAYTVIQPALTNPETAKNVNAWYLAGKAAAGKFEEVWKAEQLGQAITPEQKKEAGKSLGESYKYYMAALPLDSLPDEKLSLIHI